MLRVAQTGTALALFLTLAACSESAPPTAPDSIRFTGVPAEGNGNKLVFPLAFDDVVSCNGDVLDLHVGGWVQVRFFGQPSNRNVELDVWHIVLTYTNAAGDTYLARDVGPDHLYFDKNGDLIVTITGRSLTGSGMIGHVVINLNTGATLLVAGKDGGDVDMAACDALT